MVTVRYLVSLLWVLFVLYWLVSARWSKRAASTRRVRATARFRTAALAALLVLVILMRRGFLPSPDFSIDQPLIRTPAAQAAGLAVCLLGFALAVWARLALGRNWGTPMSLRVGHELVTSGPYAHVRHPIYTGVLLAALGSAFAQHLLWLALFGVLCPYFIYSAHVEEKLMLELFPEQWPAYRQRTWMLIPFVL